MSPTPKRVVLGNIARISSGGTPSRSNGNYWNGKIPWVKTAQIQNCMICKTDIDEWITEEGLNKSSTKMFPAGTILMAMYGQGKTRGQVAVLNLDASTNQACAAIELCKGVCRDFVFQSLLGSYTRIRNMSNTGGQENLSARLIKEIPLSLPPLPEQKAISALLSTWDEAIEITERLIQAKEKRFKLQLSEIISNIEEDNSSEFVEVGKILSYEQPTKYIVESSDYVEDGKTPVLTANKSFILGYTNEESGVYTDLPVIIFDDFTTDSKFIDFPFKVKSSALKILKPASNVNALLVYWLVTRINAPVGGHKRHWISEYQYNEILLPELSQQKKFSKILWYAQDEIDLLKQLADKYKTQKRGLMQKMLTGEWRVTPEIVNQYMEA